MSLPTLRNYQVELNTKLLAALRTHDSIICVSATGSGKTVSLSALVKELHNDDTNLSITIAAHREELIFQISETLSRFKVAHRILAPSNTIRAAHAYTLGNGYNSKIDHFSKINVMSVQSYKSYESELIATDYLIVDECVHITIDNIWGKVVSKSGKHKLVGFTATPIRTDKKEMSDIFDIMIIGKQPKWLIEHGYLTPYRVYLPDNKLDKSALKISKNGDYSEKSLIECDIVKQLGGNIVDTYINNCSGKRVLVFAESIKSCESLADSFNFSGIPAETIHSKMNSQDRRHKIRKLKNGQIKVLINVGIFTEGTDIPALDAIFMTVPTMSCNKYLQMFGRVLRLAENKETAYVFDFVGNTRNINNPDGHLTPSNDIDWKLDMHDDDLKSSRSNKEVLLKPCTNCLALIPSGLQFCYICNAQQEKYNKNEKVIRYEIKGELVECLENKNRFDLMGLKVRLNKSLPKNRYFPSSLPNYVLNKLHSNKDKFHDCLRLLLDEIESGNTEDFCIKHNITLESIFKMSDSQLIKFAKTILTVDANY